MRNSWALERWQLYALGLVWNGALSVDAMEIGSVQVAVDEVASSVSTSCLPFRWHDG